MLVLQRTCVSTSGPLHVEASCVYATKVQKLWRVTERTHVVLVTTQATEIFQSLLAILEPSNFRGENKKSLKPPPSFTLWWKVDVFLHVMFADFCWSIQKAGSCFANAMFINKSLVWGEARLKLERLFSFA